MDNVQLGVLLIILGIAAGILFSGAIGLVLCLAGLAVLLIPALRR